MITINNDQKNTILKTVNEMNSNIGHILKEIDDTKELMEKLCKQENLDTYYTWTINKRLNEAKIRLEMAQIRIEEFKEETNSLKLRTSGFY